MALRPLRSFTVLPHLPPRLQPLQKLAYNVWWCWNPDPVFLFRRIDNELFAQVEHSPVKLLATVPQERFEELLHDEGFLAHMDRVTETLDRYLAATTWFDEVYGKKGMTKEQLSSSY